MEKNTYRIKGKDYNVFPLKASLGPVNLVFMKERYLDGTLAVVTVDVTDREEPEQFAMLTVNLCDLRQDDRCAFFDGNNCGSLFSQLVSHRIIQSVPVFAVSGFCRYQLCEWDTDRFTVDGDKDQNYISEDASKVSVIAGQD